MSLYTVNKNTRKLREQMLLHDTTNFVRRWAPIWASSSDLAVATNSITTADTALVALWAWVGGAVGYV